MTNSTESTQEPDDPLSFKLNDLASLHPRLSADHWRSPLVYRLLRKNQYADGHAEFSVDYRWNEQSKQTFVTLIWEGLADDFARCLASYQEVKLTEHATIGLACVLTRLLPGVEITEVTRLGERADYWIGDREYLLEISGQQAGNLDNLRDAKARQLLDNPFGKPGFVCVAGYNERRSYLWFYEVADDSP